MAAIVIAAIVLYGTGFSPKNRQDGENDAITPEIDFRETGNMVKNNPGFKPDAWYLVYEKPGAPAMNKELVFDGQSRCKADGETGICVPSDFGQGERAAVEGVSRNGAVQVRILSRETKERTQKVKLYYYDPEKDKDAEGNILCSRQGLAAVEREIPLSLTPIQDTIRLLISGDLNEQEKQRGITTEFPLPGFELKGASTSNGLLTLEFADPNNRSGGGSCRAGILWFQIEATAMQFEGVEQVRFVPETLFQP